MLKTRPCKLLLQVHAKRSVKAERARTCNALMAKWHIAQQKALDEER